MKDKIDEVIEHFERQDPNTRRKERSGRKNN
jgi:hypothetical protein